MAAPLVYLFFPGNAKSALEFTRVFLVARLSYILLQTLSATTVPQTTLLTPS